MSEVATLVRIKPGHGYAVCSTCGCNFPIRVSKLVSTDPPISVCGENDSPLRYQNHEEKPLCEPERCPGCNRLIYKVVCLDRRCR